MKVVITLNQDYQLAKVDSTCKEVEICMDTVDAPCDDLEPKEVQWEISGAQPGQRVVIRQNNLITMDHFGDREWPITENGSMKSGPARKSGTFRYTADVFDGCPDACQKDSRWDLDPSIIIQKKILGTGPPPGSVRSPEKPVR